MVDEEEASSACKEFSFDDNEMGANGGRVDVMQTNHKGQVRKGMASGVGS